MPVELPLLQNTRHITEALAQRGGPRRVDAVGAWGSGKTILALQAAQVMERPLLVITRGRIEAEHVHEDLVTFAGEDRCSHLPAWEVLPTDVMAPSDDVVAERMHTLKTLARAMETGGPAYAAAPVRSLLQHVVQRERLMGQSKRLAVGEEYELEDLVGALVDLGYNRELMVEDRGVLSVRGGILDIFPISEELPVRIEFFGDEIESIRRFEPETQRSIERIDAVDILPRSEKALLSGAGAGNDQLATVLDYFPENTLVAIEEPLTVRDEALQLAEQFGDRPFFLDWETLERELSSFSTLTLAQIPHGAGAHEGTRVQAAMHGIPGWQHEPEGFWRQLEAWNRDGYTAVLLCNNAGERRRLLELLEDRGYRPGGDDGFKLRVELGNLHSGFVSEGDRLAVLSEREIFGRHYIQRKRRRFEAGETVTAFSDLKVGDYVVHEDHGIACYHGLRRFEGKAGDFLALKYQGGDTLYVPASHIDAIQKYTGGDGAFPKIDKLGGATWARTKAKVKKAVRDMTEELVALYARRESQQGVAFSPDTPWQREFEDAFPYEETPDQARAILDVKADMQKGRPMDRLVCGDVGYGKTEVALRAAFKAAVDGKQAAVLVPTTVLAEQHYLTFKERLADYPARVEMMSRFRTQAQLKKTAERLKSGEVDIVIGTHRLISKDIQFKDLGLVIIDEEQRFGVAQKERLKQLRTQVDVLTLSATPIPRTLNLSLMGVRDMSIINTAPNDRLPIHTCIDVFDERLIQEAIERELARQGQVFFVYNRVKGIQQYADLVRKLVPHARVAVGHGQMAEHELERVMTSFIHHEIDVLVCTTIIGSGLDIPNANTIIVNNAGHFGLAELYQLRGRVGRYKHRAFAYLLVPGERAMTEDAQKRLKALEEFSSLGSGLRIAMRDLEIRGCGNILGGEQHGNIAAVGYETYTQLIQETVAELKGEPIRTVHLPPFEYAVDAYIPAEYVPSETQKITLYKRVSGVRGPDDLAEMEDELKDRFGAPPAPVRRLLGVMRVRALGAELGAKRVLAAKRTLVVEMTSGRFHEGGMRNALVQAFGKRIQFAWKNQPSIELQMTDEAPETVLEEARKFLETLLELEE